MKNLCLYSPVFLKPLSSIVCPTLLAHYYFVAGSFTIFIKKSTQFNHMYRTLSVKKFIKAALGFSGIGFLALYKNVLSIKTSTYFKR